VGRRQAAEARFGGGVGFQQLEHRGRLAGDW
jgi:hypothetical protein